LIQNSITSYLKNQEGMRKRKQERKKGKIIDHMTERKRCQNLAKVLQRFFAKLNGSMKLLGNERPRIIF